MIAQRQQEIVFAVVVLAKKGDALGDQVPKRLLGFRFYIERFFAIGNQVQSMPYCSLSGQVKNPVMGSCRYRGIDQCGQ